MAEPRSPLLTPARLPQALALVVSSLLLGACGSLVRDSAPDGHVDHHSVPDAVPRHEPFSRYGNPDSYEVFGRRYTVLQSASGYYQEGTASWYGTKFHGQRTSSGEPYNMYAMTAAHKTLPIPVYVEVTHLQNGRKVVVRVNDRGPFVDDRIIDLSYVAAKKLGISETGTGPVSIRVIDALNPPAVQAADSKPAATAPAGSEIAANNTVTLPEATRPVGTDAAAAGLIYLQVGAFSEQANATSLLQRLLTATTENVVITRLAEGVNNVYRVRIGPLASDAVVQRLRAQLGELGIPAPHIVVE